jgi:hypothetical protein
MTHVYVRRRNRKINFLYPLSLILSISICVIVNYYGTKYCGEQIGCLFEKEDYNAVYYVNVFEDRNNTKNYRLKADILKIEGKYYIDKAYWPNGGFLSFDSYGPDYPLSVGDKIGVPDNSHKIWFIELTKIKING